MRETTGCKALPSKAGNGDRPSVSRTNAFHRLTYCSGAGRYREPFPQVPSPALTPTLPRAHLARKLQPTSDPRKERSCLARLRVAAVLGRHSPAAVSGTALSRRGDRP
jgi:hypothetical protein